MIGSCQGLVFWLSRLTRQWEDSSDHHHHHGVKALTPLVGRRTRFGPLRPSAATAGLTISNDFASGGDSSSAVCVAWRANLSQLPREWPRRLATQQQARRCMEALRRFERSSYSYLGRCSPPPSQLLPILLLFADSCPGRRYSSSTVSMPDMQHATHLHCSGSLWLSGRHTAMIVWAVRWSGWPKLCTTGVCSPLLSCPRPPSATPMPPLPRRLAQRGAGRTLPV